MAKAKGAEFEMQIQRFLRMIFEEMGFRVIEARRQLAGTQNGFDVKLVFLKDDNIEYTLFFECKDYNSALTWNDIFQKVCDLESTNYVVDGFIALSPRVPISNTGDKSTPKLKKKFPFPIKIWDSNSHLEEFLSLEPEIYKFVYGKECGLNVDRATCLKKNKEIIESILKEKLQLKVHAKEMLSSQVLLTYCEELQKRLSAIKNHPRYSLEIDIEHSISISVLPSSFSQSEEAKDHKSDFEAINYHLNNNGFFL